MESVLLNIKDIVSSGRWDYDYNQVKYVDFEKKLQNIETKSLQSFCKQSITKGETPLWKGDKYVTETEGVLFIRSENVREHGLDLSSKTFVPTHVHERMQRSQVQAGDVLLAIVGATIGQVAVVPDDIEAANCNQAVAIIRPREDVNPYYLRAILQSTLGQTQIHRLSGGTARPNLDLWEARILRIPAVSKLIQDQIAQVMQEAYGKRQEKLERAKALLQGIDDFVFDVLNIAPESVEEETRFLRSISSLRGGRFDVEFNMGFHKFDPYMDQVQPVKDIAVFPKETKDPTNTPETSFNYIDIASIDIELGEIREVSEILGSDAPSRARQVVHPGEIIISTVRPTRGAIALIPESMDGFICSTGFSIVRPNNQVTSEYLHTALRLHTTLEQFGRRSAGSSYPAILDKDVKATLIPVPHKEIQDKISVEVIRRRSEAKQLRIEAKAIVSAAKARIEKMILGEEIADGE